MKQEIQWGPAIAVDGKRPGWLADRDTILPQWPEWSIWKMGVPVWRVSAEQWADTVALRLPADHPYYRQTEEAPIDWSGELEAVHEDGRVVAVKLAGDTHQPDRDGDYNLTNPLEPSHTQALYFRADGSQTYALSNEIGGGRPWRIRNVSQPTPQADTKPDLTARMEAVMREYARGCNDLIKRADGVHRTTFSEAQAIVALLPEPVDPVEAIVDELMRKDCTTRQAIEEAVHRGRALALAEEKEA